MGNSSRVRLRVVSIGSQVGVLIMDINVHLVSVGTLLANKNSKELHPDPCTRQGVGKS